MTHWTQTPEGKRKLVRILRKANAAKAAKHAAPATPPSDRSPTRVEEVEFFLKVDQTGGVTTLVPGVDVWPFDNEGTTAYQFGDVIVKVNGRRIA